MEPHMQLPAYDTSRGAGICPFCHEQTCRECFQCRACDFQHLPGCTLAPSTLSCRHSLGLFVTP